MMSVSVKTGNLSKNGIITIFVVFLVALVLCGCSTGEMEQEIWLYSGDRWRTEATLSLDAEEYYLFGSVLEDEIEQLDKQAKNYGADIKWEKHNDEQGWAIYKFTAEGQGLDLLNKAAFNGVATVTKDTSGKTFLSFVPNPIFRSYNLTIHSSSIESSNANQKGRNLATWYNPARVELVLAESSGLSWALLVGLFVFFVAAVIIFGLVLAWILIVRQGGETTSVDDMEKDGAVTEQLSKTKIPLSQKQSIILGAVVVVSICLCCAFLMIGILLTRDRSPGDISLEPSLPDFNKPSESDISISREILIPCGSDAYLAAWLVDMKRDDYWIQDGTGEIIVQGTDNVSIETIPVEFGLAPGETGWIQPRSPLNPRYGRIISGHGSKIDNISLELSGPLLWKEVATEFPDSQVYLEFLNHKAYKDKFFSHDYVNHEVEFNVINETDHALSGTIFFIVNNSKGEPIAMEHSEWSAGYGSEIYVSGETARQFIGSIGTAAEHEQCAGQLDNSYEIDVFLDFETPSGEWHTKKYSFQTEGRTTVATPTIVPTPKSGIPPQVVIYAPASAVVGEEFELDGSRSVGASTLVDYVWDFGDGTVAQGPRVRHTYIRASEYIVSLTVMDQDGLSSSSRMQITASEEQPPVVVIVAPAEALAGELITFDGSGSTSANPIVNYTWDFGDRSQGGGPMIEHVYNSAGTYIVTLSATDNEGISGQSEHEIVISTP